MVQAMIRISDRANRVLNIVKAKYNLKDKSKAIERVAREYEERLLEPSFRPEFIEEVKKVQAKGKFRRLKSVEQLFR